MPQNRKLLAIVSAALLVVVARCDECFPFACTCLHGRDAYKHTFSQDLVMKFSQRQTKTLVLELNGWTTQTIITEMVRIILAEHLDLDVKVKSNNDTRLAIRRLQRGEVDFNLELWRNTPEKVEEEAEYFGTGLKQLKDLGLVGYNGRSGWYVHRSSATDVEERAGRADEQALNATDTSTDQRDLRFYDSYYNAKYIDEFARASEVVPGRQGVWSPRHCYGQDCAALLKVNEAYDSGVVEAQIVNGQLNFTVVHAPDTLDIVAKHGPGKKPMMFYWWEPDIAIAKGDYLRVELENSAYDPNFNVTVTEAWLPNRLPADFHFGNMFK